MEVMMKSNKVISGVAVLVLFMIFHSVCVEADSWSGWTEVPGGGTTDVALSASTFAGKVYLFGRGINDSRIYLNTGSAYHGKNWSGWSEVPGGGTTDASLACTPRRDKLYLFAKGINDRGIYLNTMSLSEDWSGWSQVPGDGTTDKALRAATYDDKMYLFAKGIDDHRIYLNVFDGVSWSGWNQVPGDGATNAPLATAVVHNALYLFARGIDDMRIYMNRLSSAAWSGWREVPGGRTTDVGLSAASIGTQLQLFAKGIDDRRIYVNTLSSAAVSGSEIWSGWNEVPGTGTTDAAVAATAGASNKLFLFSKGIDDRRVYININSPGTPITSLKQLWQIAHGIKAQKLLEERVNGPQFIVDGDTFSFYQGDLPALWDSGFTTAEMPILIPLARVIQIEDLRRFLNQHPGSDPAFWEPFFREAEGIIEQKSLAAIAAGNEAPEVIYQQVASYDSAIGKILSQEATVSFGEAHGLQFRKPNLVAAMKYLVSVSFSIDPQPARLFVVTETGYDLAVALGIEPRWREIAEDKPQLGGWYYYKIVWPDNTVRQDRIYVDQQNKNFPFTK